LGFKYWSPYCALYIVTNGKYIPDPESIVNESQRTGGVHHNEEDAVEDFVNRVNSGSKTVNLWRVTVYRRDYETGYEYDILETDKEYATANECKLATVQGNRYIVAKNGPDSLKRELAASELKKLKGSDGFSL
jgi:hypothetical protein